MADSLAFTKDIQSISELCVPSFTEGMMVSVIMGGWKNLSGMFADEPLGITQATPPKSAAKIQCMAVVRKILHQPITPDSPPIVGPSEYLSTFHRGLSFDIAIDLESAVTGDASSGKVK